jgi:hypothetical protein
MSACWLFVPILLGAFLYLYHSYREWVEWNR